MQPGQNVGNIVSILFCWKLIHEEPLYYESYTNTKPWTLIITNHMNARVIYYPETLISAHERFDFIQCQSDCSVYYVPSLVR